MGEYRFSIYFKPQIGFMIQKDYGQLVVSIPFIDMRLSFSKNAKGANFFNQ